MERESETGVLPTGPAPSCGGCSRRHIHLRRPQGLADRLRSDLAENAPQRADAMRKGVAAVLDDLVKLLGKGGGFFVGQFKVHEL